MGVAAVFMAEMRLALDALYGVLGREGMGDPVEERQQLRALELQGQRSLFDTAPVISDDQSVQPIDGGVHRPTPHTS
jgi:hypothetical protein